jgi:hypothetical protein
MSSIDLFTGLIIRPEYSNRAWCICDHEAFINRSPWPTRNIFGHEELGSIPQAVLFLATTMPSAKPVKLDIDILQGVSLATEPGISLLILPVMRILQPNLKRNYLIV